MSKGIGRIVSLGIARETSRGTAIGTPTYGIAYAELDIDEKDQRAIDDQARAVIEGSAGESIIKQWMEGNIKAPIGDAHFPLILYAILGTLNTVTGTATGTPYYHTITVLENAQHPTLTVQLDDPNGGQDYTHALTVIPQVEINYVRDNFLNYAAGIKGKKGAAATVVPVAPSENRFLPQHVTFKWATTQAGLTTGTPISIRSAKITINQNIMDDDVLGNVAPNDFLTKQFEITGEIEALFQNETDFKTDSLTGTPRAIRFDIVNTAVSIGTGSTNPALRIDLHKAIFQPLTKPIRLNDMVVQKLQFRAHYNTTDSRMVTITATNNQTSY